MTASGGLQQVIRHGRQRRQPFSVVVADFVSEVFLDREQEIDLVEAVESKVAETHIFRDGLPIEPRRCFEKKVDQLGDQLIACHALSLSNTIVPHDNPTPKPQSIRWLRSRFDNRSSNISGIDDETVFP